jgi:AraC family transcriptional regulator
MEWFERMKNALDFMEECIATGFDVAEAARVANSSSFHFQRMFTMIMGVTVADYVRKRRLTLAAQELASSHEKVIDVALKYGYDTPEAFSKAFRKVHGVAPSRARTRGISLKAYPRLSFHISLRGGKDMDYKIIEKPAFTVFGKGIRVTTKDGENFKIVPKFWAESDAEGLTEKLCARAPGADECFGICMDMDHEKEEFTYMIAVRKPDGIDTRPFEEKVIPLSTWAVFEAVGPLPESVQKVWQDVYSEWFPSTGYEHTGGPELEVYPSAFMTDPQHCCQIWVPIVKK